MKTLMLTIAAALFVLLVTAMIGANAQDANSRDGGHRPNAGCDNCRDGGNRY